MAENKQPITYPNLALEMEQTGILVKDEMIDRLFDNNSVVTGQLAKSITPGEINVDKDGINLPISFLEYGVYVDNGAERGAGGMPPVKAIKDWIKFKRVTVPVGFTQDQFAWAVARSIQAKGQRFKKPKPWIQVSLDTIIERNLNNIGNAAALDVDEHIEINYSEIG